VKNRRRRNQKASLAYVASSKISAAIRKSEKKKAKNEKHGISEGGKMKTSAEISENIEHSRRRCTYRELFDSVTLPAAYARNQRNSSNNQRHGV